MVSRDSSADAGAVGAPSLGWVFARIDRIIAFGLGVGLLRPAPGTWGTALGWLLWVLVLAHFSDAWVALTLLLAFGVGCWACERCGRALGRPDDGGMVWDEIVAFWLVLWLSPPDFWAQLLAFLIFRAFDIIKPPPIAYFDRRYKNGFGVMLDDLLAAIYSLLVIALIVRLGGWR